MILYFADFQSLDNFKETWAELEIPFAMCEKSKFNLVGFCNGLFCIHYEPFDVFLWNPWIKKHHKLPFSQTLDDLLLWDYKYFSYGFGFDDVADDYKIEKTFENRDPTDRLTTHLEFMIYSSKSNLWKSLPLLEFSCFHSSNSYNWAIGILVNSVLHWLVGNGDHDSDFSFLAIDLRTEEYQVFSQLTDMPNDHMWDMAAVEGSLSVLFECVPGCVERWKMKDHGVIDSWTKLVVELPWKRWHPFFTLAAYLESNEQLVFQNEHKEFLWYDTPTKLVQESNFASLSNSWMMKVYCCFDNLVQPSSCPTKCVKHRSSRL